MANATRNTSRTECLMALMAKGDQLFGAMCVSSLSACPAAASRSIRG
jgi:hypothetical protein